MGASRTAKAKFKEAEQMLFDRDGLEMASHETVAAYHASRYPEGVRVADLTSGIGADLVALARRGEAVGFELDEVRAAYARHNLEILGLSADILVIDSLVADWDFQYAYADPARRVGSSRTLNPADFSPDPVLLAERFRGLRRGAMKLSPMLRDDFLLQFGGELEFVSFRGECREALVWLGRDSAGEPDSLASGHGRHLSIGTEGGSGGSGARLSL